MLAHEPDLALIIADARLGDQLLEMSESLSADMPSVPLLVVTTRAADAQLGRTQGVLEFLQQPFTEELLLASVDRLARQRSEQAPPTIQE